MRTIITILTLTVHLATALPIAMRAPEKGIFDPLSAVLGNDVLTKAKALPDKNVDPSPLGVDNMMSRLPLPDMAGKRTRSFGSDGLLAGSGVGLDRAGIVAFGNGGYHPLRTRGKRDVVESIASLSSGRQREVLAAPRRSDGGILDGLTRATPLAPVKQILGARAHDGSPKNHVKRLVRHAAKSKRRLPTYTGAEELNDENDAPHWH